MLHLRLFCCTNVYRLYFCPKYMSSFAMVSCVIYSNGIFNEDLINGKNNIASVEVISYSPLKEYRLKNGNSLIAFSTFALLAVVQAISSLDLEGDLNVLSAHCCR